MLRFSVTEPCLGTDWAHAHCKQATHITDADRKQPLGCSPVTLDILMLWAPWIIPGTTLSTQSTLSHGIPTATQ